MKYISVKEMKAHFSEHIASSQLSPIVITNHGKPVAVLIGIEGMTLEELASKEALKKISDKLFGR